MLRFYLSFVVDYVLSVAKWKRIEAIHLPETLSLIEFGPLKHFVSLV